MKLVNKIKKHSSKYLKHNLCSLTIFFLYINIPKPQIVYLI